MINRKIYTLAFCLSVLFVSAQQLPVNNQFLINKFSISPAYAGDKGVFEAYMLYRQDWAGIDGAPETKLITANAPLNEKMGLGVTVQSSNIGIFKTFAASVNYAYHLKFAGFHRLSFGVGAGLWENHISLNGNKVQAQNDPVIVNQSYVNRTAFDASFAVLYKFKKFNLGFTVPKLLEDKVTGDSSTSVLYTLKRQLTTHLSHTFRVNDDFQVEPFAVIRKSTANSPVLFEGALVVKYMERVWAGGLYRKGGTMGFCAGGNVYNNRIVVHYLYEFSSQGMLGASSGTHEISLGLVMGKVNKTDKKKKPYMDWMQK